MTKIVWSLIAVAVLILRSVASQPLSSNQTERSLQTLSVLETTIEGGNGQAGNMFQIYAKQSIEIVSLDIHSKASGSVNARVYTRAGPFQDFVSSDDGWQLVLQEDGVTSWGEGQFTPLSPFWNPVIVTSGATQSFYVTIDTPDIRYTNGDDLGARYAWDDYIDFFQGVGKTFPFGVTFSPRIWNGRINYIPNESENENRGLATTVAGGNGSAGNQFSIVARNQIRITSFEIHCIAGGPFNAEIYTLDGPFEGKERDSGAWRRIQRQTGLMSNGDNVLTPLSPLDTAITIPAGTTQSFYVTLETTSVRYTNGNGVGSVAAFNEDIDILEGIGMIYPFGTTFRNRRWNGQINYEMVSDIVTPAPTLFPTPQPTPLPTPQPTMRPTTPPPTRSSSQTAADICPFDRWNPPEKYLINNERNQYSLAEISSIAFSEQTSPSGNRYAYVVGDGSQRELKVLELRDNAFGNRDHYTGSGIVVATIELLGIPTRSEDWEDMSLGPCTDSNSNSAYRVDQTCIYIGSIGNNRSDKNTVLKIFKFVEPRINPVSLPSEYEVPVATIEYEYGRGFSRRTKDAETMFVDWGDGRGNGNGDIYVITKNETVFCDDAVGMVPVRFHRNIGPGQTSRSPYDMRHVMDDPPPQGANVRCQDRHFRAYTGGDMRSDGRLITLIKRGPPTAAYFFPRLPGQSVVEALSNLPCPYVSPVAFGLPREKKHEAVAFEGTGGRFADVSECGEAGPRCYPSLYLYQLAYPGEWNGRLDGPSSGWRGISYDDFNNGDWGNYESGGSWARVRQRRTGCSEGNAAELRGYGTRGSFAHRRNQSCDRYSVLRVEFEFSLRSYDHLDTFFLEISLDGGNNYYIIGSWAKDVNGIDEDEVCYYEQVVLSPDQFRVNSFGDQVRLRFRSSATSGTSDYVYIDNINFQGNWW